MPTDPSPQHPSRASGAGPRPIGVAPHEAAEPTGRAWFKSSAGWLACGAGWFACGAGWFACGAGWFACGAGWFACGAGLGLSSVAGAALAAHLPDRMLAPGGREFLRAGVQILGWHACALLACALWLGASRLRRLVHIAAGCFLAGSMLFCAGVATPALGGPHLGPLAPSGGTMLMLGWILLAISARRRPAAADR